MGEVEDIFARFRSEIDSLKEDFSEQVGLGDYVLTHLDEEWAAARGIQPVMRNSVHDSHKEMFAAPVKVNYHNPYVYESRNMFAFADAFASGQTGVIPRYMFEPVPVPVLRKEESKATPIGTTEKLLFDRLSTEGRDITVCNPAFSTMAVLKSCGGKVFLSSYEHKKWRKDVDDFIAKANGRLEYVDEPVGIQYLGSHSPSYIPDGKWFYLIPNPYVSNDYPTWEVEENGEGVLMRYTTKDQVRSGILRNDLPYYVYNPATVQTVTGNDKFVLISNFPFPFMAVSETFSTFHTPWFIDDYPELTSIGDSLPIYRRKDKIVYDVEGPGTYVSRRSRIKLPTGFSWVDYSTVGSYSFGRFSNAPQLTANVRQTREGETNYVVYGENIVVSSLVPCPLLASFESDGSPPFTDANGGTVYLGPVGEGCSFLGTTSLVVLHKDLRRRAHAFSPSPTGSYGSSLLPRGLHFQLNSIRVLGINGSLITHVIHEPISAECWIFGLDSDSSRKHILQHRISQLQWSSVDSGRHHVVDLEGCRPRGTIENSLAMLSGKEVYKWGDPGMEYSDIVHTFPLMTAVKVQTFVRLSPDIVLWRSFPDHRQNQYVRTSSICVTQQRVEGLQVKNNETVRDLFDSLSVSNYHAWRFVPTRDFGIIIKILRNMGWAVLCNPPDANGVVSALLKR